MQSPSNSPEKFYSDLPIFRDFLGVSDEKNLSDILEAQRKAGALFYGIQISDSALMTCMVFDRKDRHLHFVDGASGGYALAAKQMKSKLAGN